MTHPPARLTVSRAELAALLERAKAGPLSEADYATLKAALETLGSLTDLLEDRTTTLQRLRHLLFGVRTEKTRTVVAPPGDAATPGGAGAPPPVGAPPPPGAGGAPAPRPGHGRNGARAYTGARRIPVPHATVQAGQRCPGCLKGKVYRQREPACLVRIVGQAPLGATVYALEQLRCNLCGEVFTAAPPAGVGSAKYDASAGSMIALLKYGSGMPFYRLEQLQGSLGIPLPAATQWEIVAEVAATVQPAYTALIRQAAQGEVLHNDDTGATILAHGREPPPAGGPPPAAPARTGTFTSGIVATQAGREIALFFTGHQHAGENLADVLRQRDAALGPPIQMCDALARNAPAAFQVILANCLAHARRQFVAVAPAFPDECRRVLETLREGSRHDAQARAQGLSLAARLAFHQAQSGPLMATLDQWLTAQVAEHRVEPHSGLGKAIAYLRKHWGPLTRFLHVAGAPLDNNVCERALKKAILHRKNALFFKTERGAQVADLFMSLIYTCQRNGADPFHYLTTLQTHAAALAAAPQDWLPWNYRDTLDRCAAPPDSSAS